MKKIINPVELISEKDRIRIVNTLFKVKLEALAIFFLRISKETVLPSTFGWQVLKDYSKTSLSKTREESKDQKKKIAYGLQNGSSE